MRFSIMKGLAAALVAVVASTPALAREDFCLNSDGSINKTATKGYRKIEDNRSAGTMKRINGIWFSQTRNPFTGQVSYLWEVYEGRGAQAGLYSYWNTVCDQIGCSRWYQGTGLWAVQGTVRRFSGMRIVSDLERDHFCQLLDGALSDNNSIWTTAAGAQYRRVNKVGDLP
ncbi:hypothetical protein [Chenggangzhangella methanolivorans]|uniref:Uncharacterized protein n=1 Tax=Chenggangzhangella methanolivorans TaxID=1437009 RepID=A0A9E6UGI2_9HYPH|nr:hypothetical protein [Chenggangzhangella methanolivorans]QZN98757.1 hypothetical protein K6K41_17525 [Chenggangzhangella methanolivorans]